LRGTSYRQELLIRETILGIFHGTTLSLLKGGDLFGSTSLNGDACSTEFMAYLKDLRAWMVTHRLNTVPAIEALLMLAQRSWRHEPLFLVREPQVALISTPYFERVSGRRIRLPMRVPVVAPGGG
jgi:hypothetical protein